MPHQIRGYPGTKAHDMNIEVLPLKQVALTLDGQRNSLQRQRWIPRVFWPFDL